MNNDVIQVNDRELMGESDLDKAMEKLGFSRNSYKIWPEIKVKKFQKIILALKNMEKDKKKLKKKKIWRSCWLWFFCFR